MSRIRTRRDIKMRFLHFFLHNYFGISEKSSTFAPLFRRTGFETYKVAIS